MNASSASLVQHFYADGFSSVHGVLSATECDVIAAEAAIVNSGRAGIRGLLSRRWCSDLAVHLRQHPSIMPFVPPGFVAVECTYFEKSESRNWFVALHQDLSIPVASRVGHPQLSGWSKKEGVTFVQPPEALLSELVAVRILVDACALDDGPLRVLPRSHLRGRLEERSIQGLVQETPEFVCVAPKGSALVMRPLLLHASAKASGSSLRRVLHFLFGPADLPLGLRWHYAV